MSNGQNDNAETPISPKRSPISIERLDERDTIIDRHARTIAYYGCDFTDVDRIVIVDRAVAVARLGEEAVRRIEADD